MDLEQIQKLIKTLEESKLKKIVIKEGDFELSLEKEGETYLSPMPPMHHQLPPMPHHHAVKGIEDLSVEASRSGSKKPEVEGAHVTSPMVGTFYASSAPDQPAFVKVGERVTEGTVVCIIEAMKVMNEVKAGVSGIIAEVLVHNAQPIEFGAKLFRIT